MSWRCKFCGKEFEEFAEGNKHGMVCGMEFEWAHKRLNPQVDVPENCPLCGVRMCDRGWEIFYEGKIVKIICLACHGKFGERCLLNDKER